ncbi:unnamed protein product, partial [Meganyctiphanes norvegica]
MRVLLLLALFGLSQALQPGYEYKYKYRGRVATGIPNINSQVAASAFESDVTVQVISKEDMRVQFNAILIGDMNDRVTCEDKQTPSDGYEQIKFNPLVDFLDQVASPFKVNMIGDQMKPFYFNDGDSTWVRNIKRAFVHVLHIPTAAPNLEETPISNSPSFQRIENHPLGECPSWYTVTPLKEHLLKFYMPAPLGSDEQTDLDNTMWKMTKSVDFDNCTDSVSSHTFGLLLDGKTDNRKCGEEYVSTATTGFYVLRGGPRGVRIEKAVQEGTYVIDHDHVHTYTNQTLDLLSVTSIGSPLAVTGESQYSFKQ